MTRMDSAYLRSPLPVWRLRWRVLTTPSCWFRSFPAHAGLSQYVNRRLNVGEIPELSQDGASFSIGGKDFCSYDFPALFGTRLTRHDSGASIGSVMVDRKTAFRVHDLLEGAK